MNKIVFNPGDLFNFSSIADDYFIFIETYQLDGHTENGRFFSVIDNNFQSFCLEDIVRIINSGKWSKMVSND
mgnify:CR=1 FL=1